MTEKHDRCHHCGLPIPDGLDIRDTFGDSDVLFCCNGCHGAFLIISGAGLDTFYQKRIWLESGTPEGVYESEFNDTSLQPYIVPLPGGFSEISLLVDGIRCATCVWLLEKVLKEKDGIADVRVNYGSHRARIVFEPSTISPETLFNSISRLGYLPRPFSRNAIHEAAAREQKSLLIRFGTAAFLSMQLMGYSLALYAGYFQGIDPGIRQMIQYFAAAVTTPVVFYSGWPFLTGAVRSLVNRAPNMDLLIALGVGTAYLYSLFAMFAGGEVYFDTAAMIITLILLGRLLENAARNRSMSGIDKLLQLAPDTARQTDGENSWSVQSVSLVPGDRIIVLPGERVPVDAVVETGESEFDESSITGVAQPVCRSAGAPVTSGSLNLTNSITLEVTHIKAESFISRMNRLVEEAQNRKAPVQTLADRIATVFVPIVIIIAIGTGIAWTLVDAAPVDAILNAVAVLIVACPCALGLATPTAVLVATGQAAAAGVMFRGGDILEMTSRIDLIAFDKTGTLTRGTPTVEGVTPGENIPLDTLLGHAADAAAGSNHPLAAAIANYAAVRGIAPEQGSDVETVPGRGLRFRKSSQQVLLGSRLFLEENGITLPEQVETTATEVHLSFNGGYQGHFRFRDPLRPESSSTVSLLKQTGYETVLLTGDRTGPTRDVMDKLHIDSCHAEMKPDDKAGFIRNAQASGRTVLMVGDGINDAPALSQADVGCAMAGGTDIALETSDIVLTRPDLQRLFSAIRLSGKALSTIRQNLFWAFSYNFIAIPLAASGLLAPIWAAAAMATSSILVIGNSLRLGRNLKKNVANNRQEH